MYIKHDEIKKGPIKKCYIQLNFVTVYFQIAKISWNAQREFAEFIWEFFHYPLSALPPFRHKIINLLLVNKLTKRAGKDKSSVTQKFSTPEIWYIKSSINIVLTSTIKQ